MTTPHHRRAKLPAATCPPPLPRSALEARIAATAALWTGVARAREEIRRDVRAGAQAVGEQLYADVVRRLAENLPADTRAAVNLRLEARRLRVVLASEVYRSYATLAGTRALTELRIGSGA